jgi:hypothetical protein
MVSHAVLSASAVSCMASFLWPGVKDAVARGVPKHSCSARRQEARARARRRRHVSRATHSATTFVGFAYRVAPSPPSIPSVRLCFASLVTQQRLCEVGPRSAHCDSTSHMAGAGPGQRFPHVPTLGRCSAVIETVRRTHRIVIRKTRRFHACLTGVKGTFLERRNFI